jgi:ABC-2 type transport system ATP-binding protein
MIRVSELTKLYGDNRAIDNINFEVQRGEVVGFLGPNGAGKSTTMKIITGAMAPTSGLAEVAGFDVFDSPLEVKKRIGYLPETPPVYGEMRVKEYLTFVAELKGVPSEKRRSGVDSALEKTQLTHVQHRMIQNLSKGFRQRVGIAQALVSDPEVLILDEPTVGLDPKQVAEIRGLIQELRGQHTIILSTHILPEVEATCERVVIINKGCIVAQDSLTNLTRWKRAGESVLVRVREASKGLDVLSKFSSQVSVSKGRLPDEFELFFESSQIQESFVDDLARYILDQKLGIVELRKAQVNLEEVFLNLTYGSQDQDQDQSQNQVRSQN